jgi:hypothetical protein
LPAEEVLPDEDDVVPPVIVVPVEVVPPVPVSVGDPPDSVSGTPPLPSEVVPPLEVSPEVPDDAPATPAAPPSPGSGGSKLITLAHAVAARSAGKSNTDIRRRTCRTSLRAGVYLSVSD